MGCNGSDGMRLRELSALLRPLSQTNNLITCRQRERGTYVLMQCVLAFCDHACFAVNCFGSGERTQAADVIDANDLWAEACRRTLHAKRRCGVAAREVFAAARCTRTLATFT